MTPDVLVVGAGPAGVSAALWARSLDLTARVIEGGPQPGGQLHRIHFRPPNLAGLPAGDGPAMARDLARQLDEAGIPVDYDSAATAVETDPATGAPAARTSSGARFEAQALVIATGVRRRRLGVPGEREFEGRGVSISATRDRAQLAGRRVAVVGGGDAAYENALLLAEVDCRVLLVVRGTPRARAEFRSRVAKDPRIEVLEETLVLAILGDERLRAIRLVGPDGELDQPVEAVVVKAGSTPNTEWLAGAVALDATGYVVVDPELRTSRARIWAVGDVTRPMRPSLSLAIGHGAQALASIRATLRGG